MFDARKFLGHPEVLRLLNIDTGEVPEWDKIYNLAFNVSFQKPESIPLLTSFLWSCDIHPEQEMPEIPDDFAFDLVGPKQIVLPSICQSVGYQAFSGTENVESVRCLAPAVRLSGHAFYYSSIQRFEGAVAHLGVGTFSECESLETADLSEGTFRLLADGTFVGCGELASISLPSTLMSIGVNVFRGCRLLEEIHYQGTVKQWSQIKKHSRAPRAAVVCSDGLGEW